MKNSQQHVYDVKCPACGWVRRMQFQELLKEIKNSLPSQQNDETNAWVDMRACPHCGKTYSYNIVTREVRE